MQACYGHTEGTAGITGLLLVASAMQQAASVPVVNLQDLNPYVGAAIGDMKSMAAHAPRQLAPGVLLAVSFCHCIPTRCYPDCMQSTSVFFILLPGENEWDSVLCRGMLQQEPHHLA